ncbi:hypothetical protein QI30_18625 [Kurthia sp. 3B1D]|uniref:Uncharacterized protein n=4 Tax=Candidatus Kurthia intestinigallinarum TaxID=1562256 RepID=A0A433RP33_9BACL|nr:hypothetical protein [Kurthia sp. 3B1D]RUS51111.1 hypothetical protein QI30_18830 [Kurthia sp. 3B1D]RUS51117.1 hypothetical protein QI30_18785 [Kurthia sp. 3B1D]RUS51125.1 hypothetical protein QI30_18735 [Kurthia sp. 3B1D]RUS51127.1 hypothetical protein QI30_18730 [Kurthia sp. 3B1D]RUS51464.1 hypothetical protein QI30_18635 [Kurthia sp. 3B1D]
MHTNLHLQPVATQYDRYQEALKQIEEKIKNRAKDFEILLYESEVIIEFYSKKKLPFPLPDSDIQLFNGPILAIKKDILYYWDIKTQQVHKTDQITDLEKTEATPTSFEDLAREGLYKEARQNLKYLYTWLDEETEKLYEQLDRI